MLVEPVAAPSSRKLVPANIISERRSLMRRMTELAGSALGTAHSAVGGSQEPFNRLMTSTTRYRLDVRPGADGTRDVAAKVTAAVTGAGLSVKVRPYLVPAGGAYVDRRGDAGRPFGACPCRHAARRRAAAHGRGRLSCRYARRHRGAASIAGEVPVPPAADGAPADAAPPALTIGYLLLDQKKQPVVRGPVPPVEAPPGPAGAAPSRIVFSGAVDGLAPVSTRCACAATDSRGRVGLVEREIVLKATGAGGASAGDVLIGRIEPDRSVTLTPGALDVADTIFVQWEAVAEGAATGRFRITNAGGGATVLTVPAEIERAGGSGVRATAVVRQGLLPVGELES